MGYKEESQEHTLSIVTWNRTANQTRDMVTVESQESRLLLLVDGICCRVVCSWSWSRCTPHTIRTKQCNLSYIFFCVISFIFSVGWDFENLSACARRNLTASPGGLADDTAAATSQASNEHVSSLKVENPTETCFCPTISAEHVSLCLFAQLSVLN